MTLRFVLPAVRLVALTALLLATPGCAGRDIAEPGVNGAYQLRVVNAGSLELRDVMILTSERDTLRITAMSPGASALFSRIGAVHTDPLIRATLSGHVVELVPIEGFTGFNPKLPAGAYIMTLRAEPDGSALSVDLRSSPSGPD